MFDRVLVAMDFSPATEALVSALPGLAELGTREITLAHVTKPMGYPVSEALEDLDGYRTRLRGLAGSLERNGFDVSVDVRAGSPAAEIVRIAEERNPQILKAGSRSRSRIGEAFVGSVAWEVVRRTTRPVLLHRIEPINPNPEAALESRGSGLPGRVVYPTDFSATAERALPWVLELAEIGVPSFTLIHAAAADDTESRRMAARRFDELEGELRDRGAEDVRVEVRDASASDLVLANGALRSENMVVMGTHGRGFLPEIVLGSESRRVVRRAAARVLLVPAASEAEA